MRTVQPLQRRCIELQPDLAITDFGLKCRNGPGRGIAHGASAADVELRTVQRALDHAAVEPAFR